MDHRGPYRAWKIGLTTLITLLVVAAVVLTALLFSARSLPTVEATASGDIGLTTVESTTAEPSETLAAEDSEPEATTSSSSADTDGNGVVTTSEPPSTTSADPVPAPVADGSPTTPVCDGRGVFIIESVIDHGTGAAQSRIDELLAAHPGSTWYEPGACPSLRASVDGQAIYPVVVDYGFDFAGLCDAFYAAGGDPSVRNARLLNNQSGAQSPC